jgi:hypothetical protein
MDSVIEARRAKFGVWLRSHYWLSEVSHMHDEEDGEFYNSQVQVAWESYNAALDSLVIELPDTVANTGTLTSNAVMTYKRECRQAIEKAGVRVK